MTTSGFKDKATLELELNQLHSQISQQLELIDHESVDDIHLNRLKKMLVRKLELEDQLENYY